MVCAGLLQKGQVVTIGHSGRGCESSIGISAVVVVVVVDSRGVGVEVGRWEKSSRDGGGSNDAMHAGLHQSSRDELSRQELLELSLFLILNMVCILHEL